MPGVPVILLSNPEDESLVANAISAGAADCIAKTENYIHRLKPVIEKEIRYQALSREKTDLSSREKRLRLIVECLPVGVAVIAPNGAFLAVNQAGLKQLGYAKLDLIVGKCGKKFIKLKGFYE